MPVAGRLSDRLGARRLARGGAVVAALGALALTGTGSESPASWWALAVLVIGAGLGFVGAPTMGSLHRTLPGRLVPPGSSLLYLLNQLGAATGVAVVALVLGAAGTGDRRSGFQAVYWSIFVTILVILAGTTFLPGQRTWAGRP